MPEIRPAQQAGGVKQYGRIDLVVCLDTTGSMSPIIDAVRDHIVTHLIGEMKSQLGRNQMPFEWRARVIGYGDLDADPFYTTPFTSDERTLVDGIRSTSRSGGSTEYTLDALLMAARSPWRSDAPVHRIVVLFTDEPSHPRLHRSSGSGGVETVIAELAAQRVKLFFFGVEDSTCTELRKAPKADVTLFPEADIHAMLVKLDFRRIFEQMAKTISSELLNSPGQ
jgi:hypothetical protein